jgi:hypothetical protein
MCLRIACCIILVDWKQIRWVTLLAIYIKKYVKAKEKLRKHKYFTMQKYNLQNIL